MGGQIAFDALGGSGVFEYELVENLMGLESMLRVCIRQAKLQGLMYFWCPTRAQADVTATAFVVAAQLVLSEKRLFIVQGSSIQLDMAGGSGYIEPIEDDPIVDLPPTVRSRV